MRWLCAATLALVAAVAADAQVLWVGAGAGTSWEFNPDARPTRTFTHASTVTPSVFVAFPISYGTLFRLRGIDIPHEVTVTGVRGDSRLRGMTAGVDYFTGGIFGEAVFSAGIGSYKLQPEGSHAPAALGGWEFGWYVGVGEWFPLSARLRATLELSLNRTGHQGEPTIGTATAGLALAF